MSRTSKNQPQVAKSNINLSNWKERLAPEDY